MTNQYLNKLQAGLERTQNPSVLGLDPNLSYLPESIIDAAKSRGKVGPEAVGEAFTNFNCALLEAVHDLIPAVKFQAACYEQYGLPGLQALADSLDCARQLGMVTILDAKRNDIGNSAAAYARAYLTGSPLPNDEEYRFLNPDAITLNGYLGIDGIKPFLQACQEEGKGCFILVRTSNPSAGDLQDRVLEDGSTVYEAMADLVRDWSDTYDPDSEWSWVGAVVGATWPSQARALRRHMPRQMFLIPGYGAQGGGAQDAVAGFQQGKGGLVNASRSLMLAWQKSPESDHNFARATRQQALCMRADLQEALAHA